MLVALNFSDQSQFLNFPVMDRGMVVLSTRLDRHEALDEPMFQLRPREGVVIRLESL